jgi:FAD/FMN-containing dehydrogenase/Fe-S oxidoreductase
VPIGVVLPTCIEDVIATVAVARQFGAPILNRGGGTSIPGQCCNAAILIEYSKYLHHIVELDAQKKRARVQPGLVLDDLRDEAEKHDLTFGPDPATHKWCTLGGMIGNNSCGVHSVMAGRTADNIESLEILTYEGDRFTVGKTSPEEFERIQREGGRKAEIYAKIKALVDKYADLIREKYPNIPRRVSGYNLDELLPENGFHVARALVGSECTLVTILEATVELVHSPTHRVLLVAGYADMAVAGDHVPIVLQHKPVGLEGLDRKFIEDMRKKHLHTKDLLLMPQGEGWLLIEFGSDDPIEARQSAEKMVEVLKQNGQLVDHRIYDDARQQEAIWAVRDAGLGATAHIPGEKDNWEGWEDSAVPPEKIGPYIRDFHKLMDRYGYDGSIYGHLGDGCLHVRLDWDVKSKEGVETWVRFVNEAADLVISYGGSLSGEHGDGQARGELLYKMFGNELVQAFEEFKAIWDPDWKMNPGKLVKPYRIDENLRYGPTYNPPHVKTYFEFPDDEHSFARATERCVGAGVCRREHDGVMCPSYKATREEMHVTRGRAHMLFEMMQGKPLTGGWKNEQIREALDLCLACKGCKGECPVHVDMATYKAEFLAHYYEDKMRPRTAYTMGLIYWASRLASKMPELVNLLTHTPGLASIAKRVAGIHPKRTIPTFADQTFKAWFFGRPAAKEGARKKQVILWADTFTNHFKTETAKAAVEVLEDAGFNVKVYERSMCCGRPLYDWGMLDRAKRHLQNILKVVSTDVSAGIPIVVLEPSCASVFKDELPNMLSERESAHRLAKNVYFFSEFFEKYAPDYAPEIRAKTLTQIHCHQQSLGGADQEHDLLNRMGADARAIPPTCCGMAGAFGFEESHYDISLTCAEHRTLPEVRASDKDTIIIDDGFRSREQIEQATKRPTYHIAEVMRMAIRDRSESKSAR